MKAKDESFNARLECHDQHKKFLPPLEVGQAVIVQDPHSGKWADEAIISSIRPDNLSYELSSNGRSFIRSRKMLRILPNFVRFTSPLLPSPSSSSWDPVHLQNNLPRTRTASPTATNFETSISPRGLHGSNLTGPPLAVESQPSSSSSFSSWRYGLPSDTTERPTRKLAVPNSMSSSFSPQGTIGTMTTSGSTRLLPTPAPLPGIPACRQLFPHLFPFVNEGMMDTLD